MKRAVPRHAVIIPSVMAALLLPAITGGQENGHLRIERPAKLTPAIAQSIYENAADELAGGYAAANHTAAMAYLTWTRHNTFPYLSATHGNRYVNNYANDVAGKYADLKPGETLPEGAIIAKDSFTVTEREAVFAGALFIMEKLEKGRSPGTGDWRYVMVMPDGSVFGDTIGVGADEVSYCHGCHAAAEENDFLFGVPRRYRR